MVRKKYEVRKKEALCGGTRERQRIEGARGGRGEEEGGEDEGWDEGESARAEESGGEGADRLDGSGVSGFDRR